MLHTNKKQRDLWGALQGLPYVQQALLQCLLELGVRLLLPAANTKENVRRRQKGKHISRENTAISMKLVELGLVGCGCMRTVVRT